jgi:hypothetical protein
MNKNSALAFHFHRPDVTVTAPKLSVSSSLLLPSRSSCRHGSLQIIHIENTIGINVNNLHSREFSTRRMMMSMEEDADSSNNNFLDNTSNTELAYLLPGQSLRIRIGDTTASRKAWKKRRRNASPILIPASILNVSRQALLRWNVFALLCSIGEEVVNPKNGENLLGATVGKLGRAYKRTLRGDLREHAIAMGYDSVELLLASLFDEMDLVEERENGNGGSIVRSFVEPRHGNIVLGTPLSRRQGRAMAASAGLVQFQLIDDGDDAQKNTNHSPSMMVHTGMAVPRPPSGKSISTTPSTSLAPEPLGAALRVYDGAIARRYQEGDEIDAVVHSYDDRGDGGGPLLVLTMARDPQGRGQGGSGGGMLSSPAYVVGRSSSSSRNTNSGIDDAGVERELTDLKAGDGPFDATVVAVSSRSGAAFVDCGVGRRRGKKYGGGLTRVLGMLRFEDGAVVDEADDDGVMMMKSDDFDIEAGDEIQVYIRAVSPQSGRFMVTLDPSIKDKKAKDLKLEKRADKRKERLLSKKISQEDVQNLIGNVYDGVVKAKSKTGDWYYVQPCVGEDMSSCDESWPVGVASALSKVGEPSGSSENYSVGDHVRVRLEGIDERRGQLALTLLED